MDFHQRNGTREEISFAEIMKNLAEYTDENSRVVSANHSRLIRALKTHNPVKIGNYEYGYSETRQANQRLIVFEWEGDRKKVREYSKRNSRENAWTCRECQRDWRSNKNASAEYSHLYSINGIVLIPANHLNICPPRNYELVKRYQNYLENSKFREAKSMTRKVNFAFSHNYLSNAENVNPSSSLLKRKASALAPVKLVMDSVNNYNSTVNSNSGYDNDHVGVTNQPPAVKGVKRNKTVLEVNDPVIFVGETNNADASLTVDGDKSDMEPKHKKNRFDYEGPSTSAAYNEDRMLLDIPQHRNIKARVKNFGSNFGDNSFLQNSGTELEEEPASIFAFKKPSSDILKNICNMLKIEYCNEAEKIWEEIAFESIDANSAQIQTHIFQTKNFFELLSMFFTGNSRQHEQLKNEINERFRNKMITSGKVTSEEFSSLYLNTVTEKHLSFIARYIPCRIMIIEDDMAKKFGKWKSSDECLTLALSLMNGLYSIILNF